MPVPAPLRGMLREHLVRHAQAGPDGLLFYQVTTGLPLSDTHLGKMFTRARDEAGVNGRFTFHDLRAFSLTQAAVAGATLRELQELAGHTTPGVAMRYQRVDEDHRAAVIRRLGERIAV